MIETTGGLKTEEFLLNMGPQHPSTHGVLRLLLTLDGERVKNVEPHIGYLHRSCEKIAENRTYQQFLPITDRTDYLAAMSGNMGLALAVERLMGIEMPEHADYIRVITLELQRLASHLLWYGTFALDVGAVTPFLYAFRDRERILDLFEEVCGARLTYSYIRIGGVSHDYPDGHLQKIKDFVRYFKPHMADFEGLLTENPIFVRRTKGVGCISQDLARSYALSGPMLRGTGIKWDLRRDDPYSIYPRFEFHIPVGIQGDCYDRYQVRLEEMRQSVRIIEQALEAFPDGPFMAKLPKLLKPPPGEVYSRIESPRGEYGVYIVSEGGPKPYRLKMRSPAFCNLSVIGEISRGALVADVVVILGSIDIVLGDVDR